MTKVKCPAMLSLPGPDYEDDEDGEVTTISSDNELEDAFRQFFKKYHETEKNLGATEKKLGEELRFRITMTIPKD